jgi:hypothetical protein
LYSREESAKIKTAFWTAYGVYMSPVPSSEGEKINWINYRTGEKYIQFKTEIENRTVTLAVVFNHPDPDIRALYFEQFEKFKQLFENEMGEDWVWQPSGKSGTRIYTTLEGFSLFNKEHWPNIISFLKQKMTALDSFWNNIKYAFEELR